MRFTSLAILAVAATGVHAAKKVLTITGKNFHDHFEYQSIADPTHGRVNYVNKATAQKHNLTSFPGGRIVLRADAKSKVFNEGPGRMSVRVRSKKQYGEHILIADVNHMPEGRGTWPALWETRENGWPSGGEIDIIEGVNDAGPNAATLHTTPGCKMGKRSMTGKATQADCNYKVNGNAGCGVKINKANSYGPAFNKKKGGIYAMQRTKKAIKVWFWPRGTGPKNVRDGATLIAPKDWGKPVAHFPLGKDCPASKFSKMNIIINLTFCGDWAGSVFKGKDGKTGLAACNGYVNDAPGEFKKAYWDIKALRIYTTNDKLAK